MREIVNMDCYLKCTFPEVTYKDILDVPIPSFNFKPFDRVLVRGSQKTSGKQISLQSTQEWWSTLTNV